MGVIARFRVFVRVMRRKKRPLETLRLFRQRPALLLAVNAFEAAQMAHGRVKSNLKALAEIKTSALIGCPF
jgi:hypothetical protein